MDEIEIGQKYLYICTTIIGEIAAADAIVIKIVLIPCNVTRLLPVYLKVQKIFVYFEYFAQIKRNAAEICSAGLVNSCKKTSVRPAYKNIQKAALKRIANGNVQCVCVEKKRLFLGRIFLCFCACPEIRTKSCSFFVLIAMEQVEATFKRKPSISTPYSQLVVRKRSYPKPNILT